ncbi:MAG: diaminopimelate decarboxylase family protein [Pseudanabaenaceae cyanobacterium]
MQTELWQQLLAIYGSPLYVYDADRLWQTLHQIPAQVPYRPTTFCFAVVTNGNLALLQLVRRAGWHIHANTPGDIYLALKAGFAPHQIVYSGSNLSVVDMQQILAWGVTTFNLDSVAQVQQLCELAQGIPQLKLGLRLHEPAIIGESRIGVQPPEFPQAVAIARKHDRQIQGLHFYRGTGTNATKAFTTVIDQLIGIGRTLPDWQYLDFGGGFGYPYRHSKVEFDWQTFGDAITKALTGTGIHLILEPGRNVIAGCGILLTTVVAVKYQGEKQIVGVDTTIANFTAPSVYGDYREIIPLQDRAEKVLTDVCGNTTYSRDYLGKNLSLPPLQIGDKLAILDVGAYGYAMASHFLHRPKPAEVVIKGKDHCLVRSREDYSVLLSHQQNMEKIYEMY